MRAIVPPLRRIVRSACPPARVLRHDRARCSPPSSSPWSCRRAAPPAARPVAARRTSSADRAGARCRGSRSPAASAVRCRCRTSDLVRRASAVRLRVERRRLRGRRPRRDDALKFSAARPLAEVMAAQIAANAPARLLPRAEAGGGGWRNPFVEGPVPGLAPRRVPRTRAPADARLRPRRASLVRARAKNRAAARASAASRRRGLASAGRLARGAPRHRAARLPRPRPGAAQRDPRR